MPSKKMTVEKLLPVREYFKAQTRFRALTEAQISAVEDERNAKWTMYMKNRG